MHKTCFNCCHFHGCLAEENPSQYHIHNYCDKFNMVLEKDSESEVNRFLNEYWKTMYNATIGSSCCVSDDFETGEAVCWMFDEAEKAFWPDEKFKENKQQNRELAIKTLEYMFQNKKVYDDFEEVEVDLDDYFNKEEQLYFKNLLKRLKEEK